MSPKKKKERKGEIALVDGMTVLCGNHGDVHTPPMIERECGMLPRSTHMEAYMAEYVCPYCEHEVAVILRMADLGEKNTR